ncbi:MAG: ribonuclease HII [bacterium]|nr:ribonuclease HII [bacterium]
MTQYIIGIDEAGRGPLAGPVAVGVALVQKNFRPKTNLTKVSLKDSKQLPERAREAWFKYIKTNPKIFYAVAMVHQKTIDRINISQATNLAATRALQKLITNNKFPITKTQIYLDAGIKINTKPFPKSYPPAGGLNPKSLIKGDERITAIKLASIAAKVRRDAYMVKKHKLYPKYNFNMHKGYGTKAHSATIKKFGPCVLHRKSFIRNLLS